MEGISLYQNFDPLLPLRSFGIVQETFLRFGYETQEEAASKGFEHQPSDVLKRVEELEQKCQECIQEIQKRRKSRVVVIHSEISPNTADIFAEVLDMIDGSSAQTKTFKLDVILSTYGGLPSDAYRIARQSIEVYGGFSLIVPQRAKSAGTLIATGAKEIIMGLESELGPIDPQVEHINTHGVKWRVPAISIKRALDAIDQKTNGGKNRDALQKFIPILSNMDMPIFGSNDIIIESIREYARELLTEGGMFGQDKIEKEKLEKAADKLLEGYNLHDRVIWYKEAEKIGLKVHSPKSDKWDKKLWVVVRNLYLLSKHLMEVQNIHGTPELEVKGFIEVEGLRIFTE